MDASIVLPHDTDSETPLLSQDHNAAEAAVSRDNLSDYRDPETRGFLEMSPSQDRSASPNRQRTLRERNSSADDPPNIYGMALFMSLDFWVLCLILSLRAYASCLDLITT
jgi:hypothetical protein